MHGDMWTAINFKNGKGGWRKGVFGVKRLIARSPGLASRAAGRVTLSRYFNPSKWFRWEQWDVVCKDGGAKTMVNQPGSGLQRQIHVGAFLHLTFNAVQISWLHESEPGKKKQKKSPGSRNAADSASPGDSLSSSSLKRWRHYTHFSCFP